VVPGEEGAVMTPTLGDVTPCKKKPEPSAEEQAAVELVRLAKDQGLSLTGPDGLLKQLTKTVLETALNEEMTRCRTAAAGPATAYRSGPATRSR
jgi:hypothetical protein